MDGLLTVCNNLRAIPYLRYVAVLRQREVIIVLSSLLLLYLTMVTKFTMWLDIEICKREGVARKR